MLNELLGGRDAESVMREALSIIHENGPSDADLIEKLTYIKRYENEIFSKHEKKLIYLLGLFYKTSKPTSILEEVYSIFSDSIEQETGKSFTPVQASAYKNIQDKRYFSFSAPTSAGKSYLFRELIQDTEGDIIIVVPSRALISEYYFETVNLVDKDVLVLQFIENINTDNVAKRIFIITPERGTELFKYSDIFDVKLILLDEAQLSEEPVRGMKFDSFVRRSDRVFPKARKVFAHPFINNPEAQLKKHGFHEQSASFNYNFHTVGKIFVSYQNENFQLFSPNNSNATKDISEDIAYNILNDNGTLLVYTAKNKIYDGRYLTEFGKYISLCSEIVNKDALRIIKQLKKFIGAGSTGSDKHSLMLDMMKKGIVIHHGSMPLKARLLVEEFVRANHARICFATSTLNQGINMPFDVVWLDNFRYMDTLTLKNLIGRSGRTTQNIDSFDYGYVIVKSENITTFRSRYNDIVNIESSSLLDEQIENLDIDEIDLVEAIQSDHFDDELNLPDAQVERIKHGEVDSEIKYVLDNFLEDGKPLTVKSYYNMTPYKRNKIKTCFKKIYAQHLRREELVTAESSTLSAAIPLMLWQIQGKSFSEIVSLRHAFLSKKDDRNVILKQLKNGEISDDRAQKELAKITIRFSQIPSSLPNIRHRQVPLYPQDTPVSQLDFDTIVYDTYDYLDKVISLSMVDPICAAFEVYATKTKDSRAVTMRNYIRFGTNDDVEIWLLKYGFSFEDIEWLKKCVKRIDASKIIFNSRVKKLSKLKLETIQRYL